MTLSLPPFRNATSTSARTRLHRRAARLQHLDDRLVGDHLRQPVGAEQQLIAVDQSRPLEIHRRVLGAGVDRLRQDVPHGMRTELLAADRPGIEERLHQRVVAREPMKPPVAEEVRARIADVRDQQVGAEAAGDGHRRAHAGEVGIALGELHQLAVHGVEPFGGAREHVRRRRLVEPQYPVGVAHDRAHERADGGAARDLAGGHPAHPVRDEHAVRRLGGLLRKVPGRQVRQQRAQGSLRARDQEMVLVRRSDLPRIRRRADVDLDDGGSGSRRVRGRRGVRKLDGIDCVMLGHALLGSLGGSASAVTSRTVV